MSIWYNKNITPAALNAMGNENMGQYLGIEFTEIGADFIVARMPVDHRTKQPYGLLHGGASVVLAETLGSVASHCIINPELFQAVGLEINANHIRSVKEGFVYGKCTPLHTGGSSHVWDIKITDANGKIVCISRLTVAIIRKRH